MRITEYYTSVPERREHWLSKLRGCDWEAGRYLCELLEKEEHRSLVKDDAAMLFLLVEGDELISFCTRADLDDIQPTELDNFIGFVYTFPEYRGHGYAGMLMEHAEEISAAMGKEYAHVSTCHIGLYEKYGYEFLRMDTDINGEPTRVYRKRLQKEKV